MENASSSLVVLVLRNLLERKEKVLHAGVILKQVAADMNKAVQFLEDALLGVRVSGVTAAILDTVKVSYYGQPTPIKHLAQSADVPGRVMITPYDCSILNEVAAALQKSGFNAYVFSKSALAVTASALSGAERDKVKAQVKKLGEDAKIAVRGVRRQHRQQIDKDLPKDERRKIESEIDALTEDIGNKIDRLISDKLDSFGG